MDAGWPIVSKNVNILKIFDSTNLNAFSRLSSLLDGCGGFCRVGWAVLGLCFSLEGGGTLLLPRLSGTDIEVLALFTALILDSDRENPTEMCTWTGSYETIYFYSTTNTVNLYNFTSYLFFFNIRETDIFANI